MIHQMVTDTFKFGDIATGNLKELTFRGYLDVLPGERIILHENLPSKGVLFDITENTMMLCVERVIHNRTFLRGKIKSTTILFNINGLTERSNENG